MTPSTGCHARSTKPTSATAVSPAGGAGSPMATAGPEKTAASVKSASAIARRRLFMCPPVDRAVRGVVAVPRGFRRGDGEILAVRYATAWGSRPEDHLHDAVGLLLEL